MVNATVFSKHATGLFVARRYGKINDLTVALVLYVDGMSHNGVMNLIQIAIDGYCLMNNYNDRKILVIGFSNMLRGFRYGMYTDVTPLDEKDEQQLIADLKMLKWFTDIEVFKVRHQEYPD